MLRHAAVALPFAVLAACEHPSGPHVVPHPKSADQIDATAARLAVPPAELASARAKLEELVTAWGGPDRARLEAPAVELMRALRTLALFEAESVPVDAFEDVSARAHRLEAEQAARRQDRGRP